MVRIRRILPQLRKPLRACSIALYVLLAALSAWGAVPPPPGAGDPLSESAASPVPPPAASSQRGGLPCP
jgi:hypothetical protein